MYHKFILYIIEMEKKWKRFLITKAPLGGCTYPLRYNYVGGIKGGRQKKAKKQTKHAKSNIISPTPGGGGL